MGDAPIAGGKWAGMLFALILVAFVLESQLTQVWQSRAGVQTLCS